MPTSLNLPPNTRWNIYAIFSGVTACEVRLGRPGGPLTQQVRAGAGSSSVQALPPVEAGPGGGLDVEATANGVVIQPVTQLGNQYLHILDFGSHPPGPGGSARPSAAIVVAAWAG